MRNKTFVTALFVAIYFGLCQPLYPFEKTYTHPALSQEAANLSQINTYLQSQLGYATGLNTQLQITDIMTPFVQDLIDRGMDQSITTRSILGWLREGSKLEDALIPQARSQHHFYDPIRNAGLDNRTDYPDWEGAPTRLSPFDLRGESALFWITTGTSSTGYPKNNLDTWEEARNRFYESLRSLSASVRKQYMAETFLALGHILHMIEDMGVPAHTRNDFLFGHYRAFYDWGNPLESWVEEQIIANASQSPWSGSGPVVFNKLAKYFDADVYAGGYLGNGILPPAGIWGLAECTNYQFMSLSTVFGCTGVKYQFPHPAIEHIPPSPLIEDNKVYFNGLNYGVPHIARDSYTYYRSTGWGYYFPVIDNTNTTDDDKVFIDYANITIPRTIDYATGLINYFFRGRLNVEPNQIDPNIVKPIITNNSNNSSVPQKLKGGTFKLYWDNEEGTRSQVTGFTVPGWNSSSTLNYGQSATGQFIRPTPSQGHQISKYIVIYQGQISQNPADPDPYDPNVVAVGIFDPPPRITKITPEMGCPGSVLLIEGSGFSTTPAENTVSFKDVNGVKPDVYGTILDAAGNGTWLIVELPYFDASDVDYYWAHTKVTVKGHVSNIYDFKLTNYIWCTIKLWDAGTSVDDEFDLYINNEYFATSYLAPPEDPTIVECGFWYEDGYDFVDTYLYGSHTIPGGTLGMSIEPYVTRVVAYRWNSASEQQEFLYDNPYSGIFSDYFGSDLLAVPNDGIQLDVYLSLTYTGTGQVQLKTRTNRIEKSTTDNSISTREARGKSASADTISKVRKPAMVHKKTGKRMNGDRKTVTRNMLRKAIYNNKQQYP